jgi:hypothetical protein
MALDRYRSTSGTVFIVLAVARDRSIGEIAADLRQ